MSKKQSIIDRCYKDKNDKVIWWQFPNAPLITGVVCLLAQRVVPESSLQLQLLLQLVGFGALFTWAWLEMFSGITYARRTVGLIVMIFLLSNRI